MARIIANESGGGSDIDADWQRLWSRQTALTIQLSGQKKFSGNDADIGLVCSPLRAFVLLNVLGNRQAFVFLPKAPAVRIPVWISRKKLLEIGRLISNNRSWVSH